MNEASHSEPTPAARDNAMRAEAMRQLRRGYRFVLPCLALQLAIVYAYQCISHRLLSIARPGPQLLLLTAAIQALRLRAEHRRIVAVARDGSFEQLVAFYSDRLARTQRLWRVVGAFALVMALAQLIPAHADHLAALTKTLLVSGHVLLAAALCATAVLATRRRLRVAKTVLAAGASEGDELLLTPALTAMSGPPRSTIRGRAELLRSQLAERRRRGYGLWLPVTLLVWLTAELGRRHGHPDVPFSPWPLIFLCAALVAAFRHWRQLDRLAQRALEPDFADYVPRYRQSLQRARKRRPWGVTLLFTLLALVSLPSTKLDSVHWRPLLVANAIFIAIVILIGDKQLRSRLAAAEQLLHG